MTFILNKWYGFVHLMNYVIYTANASRQSEEIFEKIWSSSSQIISTQAALGRDSQRQGTMLNQASCKLSDGSMQATRAMLQT